MELVAGGRASGSKSISSVDFAVGRRKMPPVVFRETARASRRINPHDRVPQVHPCLASGYLIEKANRVGRSQANSYKLWRTVVRSLPRT